MNKPLVSILMPVYNTAPYLREAMDSMLRQTFTDFELIVLNDCSPDNAEEILDTYNDPRIVRYKGEQNVGLANILNKGMQMAKGKYIARMDSDDISMPNRLQVQVDYLEKHPDIDLCSAAMELFGEQHSISRLLPSMDDIKITAIFYSPILHASSVWRRERFEQFGLNFEQEFVPAEDYRMWTRALQCGLTMVNLPDVLYRYRFHAGQATKNISLSAQKCALIRADYLTQIFPNALADFRQRALQMERYMKEEPEQMWRFFDEIIAYNQQTDFFDSTLLKKRLYRTAQSVTLTYLKNNPVKYSLLGRIRFVQFVKLLIYKLLPPPAERDVSCRKLEKSTTPIGVSLHDVKTWRRARYHRHLLEQLKNLHPSLLANNCNATFLMHDMGLRYLTPTVNLFIPPRDFIRLMSDLPRYMAQDNFVFVEKEGITYPIGILGGDVEVHFVHYTSPEQAAAKWNERKQRINYDNLFLMLTERDGCTYEDLLAFDRLPYANKVVFTHKPYPEIKSAVCIQGCLDLANPQEVGYLYEWKNRFSLKRWLDDFDYVSWLNSH